MIENIVYTTPCGMYQVIEKNGAFYPEERQATAVGYGRLRSQAEIDEFRATGRWTVQESAWQGWYLGETCYRVSKGYKCYKTLKSATAFVDRCSEQMREGVA